MTRSSLAAALLPAIQTIPGISQPACLLHKACCWHTRITTIRHRRTKPRSTCRAHPRSRNRGISENGFDYGSLSAAQCGSRPKTATLTILRAAICGSYPKIATLTPPSVARCGFHPTLAAHPRTIEFEALPPEQACATTGFGAQHRRR